jgi:hypothetical protein
MTTEEFVHATLEDRVFTLELALSNIGGALLAPGSWEDDQRLHQYMYDTVRRALLRTPFGEALDQREQQLFVREAAPIVNEPTHQTEPVPMAAADPAPEAETDTEAAGAPAAEPALTVAPDPAPAAVDEPSLTNELGGNGPRDYGWPTRP